MTEKMYRGDLSNLPQQDSNIVRIFTSSTFTDMFAERNHLMKNIYPQLRDVCTQLGLEFEVVDMRWGVSDKVSADHKTTELCLREISNCQRLSQGPNFIAFLGDKYGYRPFPSEIPEDEFQILTGLLKKQNTDIDILRTWFRKDDNSLPPAYILQPIDSVLLHYNDKTDQSKQQEDRKKWWEIFQSMQYLLKSAAMCALDSNVLPMEQCEKYLISVTEHEVKKGILQSLNPGKQCACFVRVLQDIDTTSTIVNDESIRLYFDVDSSGSVNDDYAKQRLNSLRFDKVKRVLTQMNFNLFDVCWKSGGIDPRVKEHKQYLRAFGESVKSVLLNLVHDFSDHRLNQGFANHTSLYTEVLHHSIFCVKKSETFHGRGELLHSLRSLLLPEEAADKKNILIIHGHSGSGKTSIMAMLASNARKWLKQPNLVIMFRFLGTSSSSSNLESVIHSLCGQICEVYEVEMPTKDILEDLNKMIQFFQELLQNIQGPPLLLLLDSIDQLSSEDDAFALEWLPNSLNDKVTMVISTLPDYENIFTNLKKFYKSSGNFLQIGILPSSSTIVILRNWLKNINRSLTQDQNDFLTSCAELCPSPIYLKLAFDQAKRWKSYNEINSITLPITTNAIIESLFKNLELEYGEILVSHALGYITASKSGLSENELEDVLSLDDFVLSDVYEFWDPPADDIIRLPPLLWKRIRYHLDSYLTERKADGAIVLNWYHRQFFEAAHKRYLCDEEKTKYLYKNLADFFMGEYANGKGKSITLQKRNKIMKNADRQVQAQPLKYEKGFYNLRKLNELPRILIKTRDFKSLFTNVLFSFTWISHKVKAMDVNQVLKDMKAYLNQHEDPEVKLLYDELFLESSNIDSQKDGMANQLLGRLLGFTKVTSNIKRLVIGAKSYTEKLKKPAFSLRSACMVPPGGPLQTTLQGHPCRITNVHFIDDEKLFCSCSSDDILFVYIWSLSDRKVLRILRFKSTKYSAIYFQNGWKKIYVFADSIHQVDVDTFSTDTFDVGRKDCDIVCAQVDEPSSLMAFAYQDCMLEILDTNANVLKAKANMGNVSSIKFLMKGGQVAVSSNSHPLLLLYDYVNDKVFDFQAPEENMKKTADLLLVVNECILVSSCNNDIQVWDCANPSHLYTLSGHTQAIQCMERINDDSFATGSKDCSIKIWSVSEHGLITTLDDHADTIWCLKYNGHTNKLISGSKDDYIKVWNLDDFICEKTLIGHSSWVSAVDISIDGKMVLSGSNDRKVKSWNAVEEEQAFEQPTYIYHSKGVLGVNISSDCSYAVSFGWNGRLLLWNVATTTIVYEIKMYATCATFTKTNSLIIGTKEGLVSVYGICSDNLELVFKHQSHCKSTVGLELICQDETIISAGGDGTLCVIDINTQKAIQMLNCHNDQITCMNMSEDNRILATGGKDKRVCLCKIDTDLLSLLYQLEGHDSSLTSIKVSVDSNMILSGDRGGTLICWDVDSGDQIHNIKISSDTITNILQMRKENMSFILSIHSFEEQLQLWTPEGEEMVTQFYGHKHAVMGMNLTKDEKFLISSSRDGTIKLWDVQSKRCLDSVNFNSQIKFFNLRKSKDGNYDLVAATKTGSLVFMRLLLLTPERPSTNGTLILMGGPQSARKDEFVSVQSRRCCCNIT